MVEADNWITRSMKARIAAWTARAEMSKRIGNNELLQKALKYKTRYEKELADLEQLKASCDERDRLQLKSEKENPGENGCPWCSMFENFPIWTNDNGTLSESSEFIREAVALMGITKDELQNMESDLAADMNERFACEKCKIQHNKMVEMFRLMRQSVQSET